MKAILCETHGKPDSLVFKNIDSPKPSANEVLIDVKACSANFPDVLIIQNLYQFKPELPFSPGAEVAGVVKDFGENVKHFKKGDKVLSLCGWGGFAEEAVVDKNRVFPLPKGMDYVTASSLMYNYGTSYHALKDRAKLLKGETLLVLGAAGGVGLAAVELGKIMGATVIAAASSAEKLAVCKEKGASHLINYAEEDLKARVKELTNGKGVDVVYDPVGDKWAEAALRSTAWNGRYLVVGFAGGEIPKIPMNLPLLKGCAIMGVFWGRFTTEEPALSIQNIQELGKFYLEGKIKPHIYKLYPLEKGADALNDLMNRKVTGKAVVITCSPEEATASEKAKPKAKKTKEVNSKNEILQFKNQEAVLSWVGNPLGKSPWLEVSQKMIDEFAEATLDKQWIHIDKEAAKSTVFGDTIAHGYLTLSLIPKLMSDVYSVPFAKMGINYGTEKVRFLHPVLSNSRIRLNATLKHASKTASGGLKMIVEASIEIEGIEKPACYAEVISVLN
ncbi:zinc-binding dehydrogenase [Arcticibacterium luteifluviistationis]|uniref:Zn-dependent oxidoreductase n=1 Tax=Arcticibacterium luteifluviistationis TaxID=1784714 RepID=A0A2Z4GF45_9BACT|nr:zinc-binding dehydrogenase [Arcticibacterium luteifluviistationis]AWV99677.1 Zn-dependent oxidoreductase [Arcticibacterium luteifluviistationis]